jgi:hypothetical protein
MNKNFLQIQTNVGTEVIDTSAAFKLVVKNYINSRYFQILRQINWQNINPDYEFNTVGGTQDYVLPDDFYKPLSVRDSTNGLELAEIDLQELITRYPDEISEEGTVSRYTIIEQAVQNQPTAATAVTIVSSSASDTTQTVLVRGISGGVELTESKTLTEATNAVTTATFTRIIGISKSAATVGKITCTAGVTLAVLPPATLESRYKIMRLHYVPAAVITIVVPYTIKPSPMSSDYDYPILDIADLIEIGAKADAWRYKKMFAKANVFEAQFTAGLADYVWDKENSPNKVTQFTPQAFDRDGLY